MDFDMKRLGLGDRIVGGSAIVLFIFFFFVNWYSNGPYGATGWTAHTLLRWLVLLTIILALAKVFMQATNQKVDLPAPPGLILLGVSGVTTVLVLFRVLIDRPHGIPFSYVSFGAWIGMLSLIALTGGAFVSIGEEGDSTTTA